METLTWDTFWGKLQAPNITSPREFICADGGRVKVIGLPRSSGACTMPPHGPDIRQRAAGLKLCHAGLQPCFDPGIPPGPSLWNGSIYSLSIYIADYNLVLILWGFKIRNLPWMSAENSDLNSIGTLKNMEPLKVGGMHFHVKEWSWVSWKDKASVLVQFLLLC